VTTVETNHLKLGARCRLLGPDPYSGYRRCEGEGCTLWSEELIWDGKRFCGACPEHESEVRQATGS
jgi:hypothetical protein